MRKVSLVVFMMILTSFMLMGCKKSVPIHNPVVNVSQTKPLTQEEMRSAIFKACPKTGWVAKDITPTEIEATLQIRSHTAIVSITYSPEKYNIQYKNSVNLRAELGTIHPNYNGWIQNLQRNIDLEIASIIATK